MLDAMPDKKEKNAKDSVDYLDLCKGHRSRLREKVLAATMPLAPEIKDYEVLEFLLALAIPRKDVKPLAKVLIHNFKDLAGVLAADTSDLMKIDGVKETTAAAIKTVYVCMHRAARNRITKEPVVNSWAQVLEYCRITFGFCKVEKAAVLYLDSGNHLLCDEVISQGTVNQTFFYPQEVLRKALTLGAAAVIVVHNHPSGSNEPSLADKELTEELESVLSKTGIILHDHIIISSKGYFSFRSRGLL